MNLKLKVTKHGKFRIGNYPGNSQALACEESYDGRKANECVFDSVTLRNNVDKLVKEALEESEKKIVEITIKTLKV